MFTDFAISYTDSVSRDGFLIRFVLSRYFIELYDCDLLFWVWVTGVRRGVTIRRFCFQYCWFDVDFFKSVFSYFYVTKIKFLYFLWVFILLFHFLTLFFFWFCQYLPAFSVTDSVSSIAYFSLWNSEWLTFSKFKLHLLYLIKKLINFCGKSASKSVYWL